MQVFGFIERDLVLLLRILGDVLGDEKIRY